jgi:hypothetical protein
VAVLLLLCAATWLWLYGPRRLPGVGAPLGYAQQWAIPPNTTLWPASAWLLPLGVLVLFGGAAALSAYDRFCRAKNRREQKTSVVLCVSLLSLLALVWPWALLGPGGTQNLINATWSDTANQYFSTAYAVEDMRQFTSGYAQRWQQPPSRLQAHVATHPPGAVLLYYGARRIFNAVPALQNTFTSLAESLTGYGAAELASSGNQVRRAAARSAGASSQFDLPGAAVGGALWSAFLLSLCVAATVPAVYWLARGAVVDDIASVTLQEGRALLAAALFALAPTVNVFAFSLDSLIACFAAWALACLAFRLNGGSPAWSIAAGVILAFTSFISFGTLAVWGIVVLAAVWHYGAQKTVTSTRSWLRPAPGTERGAMPRPLADLGSCVLGFMLGWALLLVLFPMQIGLIFRQAMAVHHEATIAARTYGVWVWLNLLMFAMFCSWPVVVGCILAVLRRLRECRLRAWRTGSPEGMRNPEEEVEGGIMWDRTALAVGVAALCTLLLLTVSGNVRGEVERLWLFALAPLCVLAAGALGRETVSLRFAALLVGLQAVQTLALAGALAPLVRPL